MANDFCVGSWTVRPSLNTISRNGTSVRLEPKVMEVLVCLASRPGQPVSKESLIKTVWADTFVSDDALIRTIAELRRVFADDSRNPSFIETIPKRGYRLVAPVTSQTGEASPKSDDVSPFRKRAATVSFAVLGVLAFGFLLGFSVKTLRERLFASPARRVRSIAVLPLQNLSNDPTQDYFAEGMTDALITDLAQIAELKVVSRTTITHYGHPDKPLPQIARELGVDGIVEGTIQRSGDRVRITAQLIYAPADQHLWARTFELNVKDTFSVEEEVATNIADQVKIQLTPEDRLKLKGLRPVNPEALDAYVNARFHLDQAAKFAYSHGANSKLLGELQIAVAYLDQAVSKDNHYLPAYVAYFDAVDPMGLSHLEFLPKARAALLKALELDPDNLEARLALGRLLLQYDYNWVGAGQQYRQAIAAHPDAAEAHFQYSEYLMMLGRGADWKSEFDLAQSLNPAHDYSEDETDPLERSGKTVDEQRRELEEQFPNDPFLSALLAKNFAMAGRFDESADFWQRSLQSYQWTGFSDVLKQNEKNGGKTALQEWMKAVEKYSQSNKDFPVVPPAFTYASLRDNDHAFVWLGKAVDQRNWMIIFLKRDPVWDPLRSDPRFSALLRRVGLPES